uniref:Uncharacterized protein n=1 Tax=Vespula pensylvanica TaxID=30213 RepID=A0A834P0Z7_VESPE|nr:hypothetical protein H0235_009032 [Vespula pensylvanica]
MGGLTKEEDPQSGHIGSVFGRVPVPPSNTQEGLLLIITTTLSQFRGTFTTGVTLSFDRPENVPTRESKWFYTSGRHSNWFSRVLSILRYRRNIDCDLQMKERKKREGLDREKSARDFYDDDDDDDDDGDDGDDDNDDDDL